MEDEAFFIYNLNEDISTPALSFLPACLDLMNKTGKKHKTRLKSRGLLVFDYLKSSIFHADETTTFDFSSSSAR